MSVAELMRQALADGLGFRIAAPEGLKIIGRPDVVQRWLPVLRPQKLTILDALLHGERQRLMRVMVDWNERAAMMTCGHVTAEQAENATWHDLNLDEVFFGLRRGH